MSISVEELYQKLIESGISEAELEKRVRNKENEFGGFMSKQGILFIIAKENGIFVQSPEISEQEYEAFEEEIDYDEFTIKLSESIYIKSANMHTLNDCEEYSNGF